MTERMKNMISAIKSCELEGAVFTEEDMKIFRAVGEGRMTTAKARQLFIEQALGTQASSETSK